MVEVAGLLCLAFLIAVLLAKNTIAPTWDVVNVEVVVLLLVASMLFAIFEVLRRSKHDWGDMQRKGFGGAPAVAPAPSDAD